MPVSEADFAEVKSDLKNIVRELDEAKKRFEKFSGSSETRDLNMAEELKEVRRMAEKSMNRDKDIEDLKDELKIVRDWKIGFEGEMKAVGRIPTVLAIVATAFGILASAKAFGVFE